MEIKFEGKMVENAESFYHMNYANIVKAGTKRRRFAYFLLLAMGLYVGVNQTFFSTNVHTARELTTLWVLLAALAIGGFFYTKKDVPLGAVVNRRLVRMCMGAEAGEHLEVRYVFYEDRFRAESSKGIVTQQYSEIKGLAETSSYLLMFMGQNRIHPVRLDSIEGEAPALENLKAFLMEKTGKSLDKIRMLESQKKNAF